jgi:acyl carrier protein
MRRADLVRMICETVIAANPTIAAVDVDQTSSLSDQLGLDSVQFEKMIAAIKERVVDINLTPWCIRANRPGEDTISSLVDYIESRLASASPASIKVGKKSP